MNARVMKLGTRLSLAFAAMLLMTVAVGGMGMLRLWQVNAGAQDIADIWLPSIKLLGEMRTVANQMRRVEADHLLSVDEAEMSAQETRIQELKAALADKTAAYEKLLSSDEERAGYESFKRHRDAYLALQPKLFELSRGGEATLDDAKKLFRSDSRTAFNAMAADIGKLVGLNDQGSVLAAQKARDTYAAAFASTLVLIGVAMAMAAGLALYIVRGVTRQIGGEPGDAAALAQRVADGDLSAPIALRAGDSTSLMAALKRMQDSLAGIVASVRTNAEGVASASAQIAQGNADLSSRTEEQASALEQTAASM